MCRARPTAWSGRWPRTRGSAGWSGTAGPSPYPNSPTRRIGTFDHRGTRLTFADGATKGSLEGDATRPGSPFKPSFYELTLDPGLFTAGENTLTLTRTAGSWISFDALGPFQTS
ncbi:hypothetical protein [Streptomyces sp. NPDC006012]|uniref:hypothetical protein n=1 Tax=Streptomyces sp. NPDC006012 TaxID=3364739 RepID=UPI00368395AB